MSRRAQAVLAALLTALALAAVLWRWVDLGAHPVAIALALFVLAGVPAVVWLSPRVPARSSPHRMPVTFWIGIAMLAAGAGGILVGLPATGKASMSLAGGSSTSPLPPAHQANPPVAAAKAVDTVFPGARIRVAYVANGGFWLLFIARGNHLIADANWQAGSLWLNHLGWNTALGSSKETGHVYSWTQLKNQVAIPKGVPVLGPYRFPGYDAMLVPAIGQVWFLSVYGQGVEGGAL